MKYRYERLRVRLSELHTQNITVPAWEAPVVQAVHGESVESLGETVHERAEVDVHDEFARLANKYREPEPGQPPFVAAVYGSFGPGLTALTRAVNEAVVEETATPVPAKDESLMSSLAS